MMKNETFAKSGLVEYNVSCFKKGISALFDAKTKFKDQDKSKGNNANAADKPQEKKRWRVYVNARVCENDCVCK